jgi:protein-S-isoprenylcysteine O-methyltransferase
MADYRTSASLNWSSTTDMLRYLTITLFVIWCGSELAISLISLRNRATNLSAGADRSSYVVVWFATIPPIGFEYVLRMHPTFANGFGDFSTLFPLLGYLGCAFIAFGVTIRLLAVATLKKQFTLNVAIVERHAIVDTGIYRIIRHPAYLGYLASLLGIGFVVGNWVGLIVLVVVPLGAIVYRIHVEERALLEYFGAAYQGYTRRTKRLFPGVW